MSAERGPKGDHGQSGDIGVRGETGARGERGATGADSTAAGERGPKGDPGATGPAGKLPILLAGSLVAVLLALFGITLAEVLRVSSFTDDLHAFGLESCVRQNEVRVAVNIDGGTVKDSLRSDIQVRRDFIPDASPDQQMALREAITRDKHNLARVKMLPLTDCDAVGP